MDIREMTKEEINRMPRLRYKERMDNKLAYQWLFRCFVRESDYPEISDILHEVLNHEQDTLYYHNPFSVAKELFLADSHQYCPKDIFIFMEKAFRDQFYLLSDTKAADYLGDLFYLPQYRHVNYQKALKYFTVAAKGGSVNALARLGIIYYRQQRLKKAYPFLLKATLLGDIEAKFHLAELYWHGKGVVKDLSYAETFYQEIVDNSEEILTEYVPRALIRLSQYKRMMATTNQSFLSNLAILQKAELQFFKLQHCIAGTDETIEAELNQEMAIVKQAMKQRKYLSGPKGIYIQTKHHDLTVNMWNEEDIDDLLRLSKSNYFKQSQPFTCPKDEWESLNLIQTSLIDENVFAIRIYTDKYKYTKSNESIHQQNLVEPPLPYDENKMTYYIKNRKNQGKGFFAIGYARLEEISLPKTKEYCLHYCFENEELANQYTEEIFEKLIVYAFDWLQAKRIWMTSSPNETLKLEYLQQNGFETIPVEKVPFKSSDKNIQCFQLSEKRWMAG